MAAELVTFEDHGRDMSDLVILLDAMDTGDSAYLSNNIQVHVVNR